MIEIFQKKNINHTIIIVTILFTLSGICASAQGRFSDKDPGEFSIFLGGGLSSIHHKDAPGDVFFNGSSIDFGIGYTHYFNRNWGIFAGLGPGIYNTRKSVNFDEFNPQMTSPMHHNDIFDLYSNIDYNETFEILFLNLPVMLRYQSQQNILTRRQSQSANNGFYAMGGVIVGLPLKDAYASEITRITNRAYFPELDNWMGTQEFAGFGVFNDVVGDDGNMNLDLSIRLALEAGLKWRLNNNFMLYTGIYGTFGLNNTTKNTREPYLNHIAVNGGYLPNFTLLSFSDKIDMMTVGKILRLAFFKQPNDCAFNPYRSVRKF